MDFIIGLVAEFVGYVLTELILSRFFFCCGWPVVKLVTLGRYPTRHRPEGSRQAVYVCCFGLATFCLVLLALLGQL